MKRNTLFACQYISAVKKKNEVTNKKYVWYGRQGKDWQASDMVLQIDVNTNN